MTIPITPAEFDAADLEITSRCIAHWRGDDLTIDLVSGQPGTFSRGATATVFDSNGVSITLANATPRFEPRDWLGTSARTHMGLLMGTSDRLHYAADWRPRACAFWIEGIETGGAAISGGGVLSITIDAATGAYLRVDSTGTVYRVRHSNGINAEVAQALAVAPTVGQRFVLRGQLYADGSVQLWQSINEGAETNTVRSVAPAAGLAASWGAGARLRLNSAGTGNGGSLWARRFKVVPGVPDYTTLSRLF
jgi:hypothetical protein